MLGSFKHLPLQKALIFLPTYGIVNSLLIWGKFVSTLGPILSLFIRLIHKFKAFKTSFQSPNIVQTLKGDF